MTAELSYNSFPQIVLFDVRVAIPDYRIQRGTMPLYYENNQTYSSIKPNQDCPYLNETLDSTERKGVLALWRRPEMNNVIQQHILLAKCGENLKICSKCPIWQNHLANKGAVVTACQQKAALMEATIEGNLDTTYEQRRAINLSALKEFLQLRVFTAIKTGIKNLLDTGHREEKIQDNVKELKDFRRKANFLAGEI
jgi:hypothetical protein